MMHVIALTRIRSSAVALLAVWCVAAPALAGNGVPLPPHTQAAPVAKKIVYNGLNMHAQVFRSTLPPDKLIAWYKKRWPRKTRVHTLGSSKVVGHVRGDDSITVQVSADGAGSKGTIGVLKLPRKRVTQPALGRGLPQPFDSKVINDISYPEDATPARTVLMVDKLSPVQNGSWFRSRLLANGWTTAGNSQCAHGADHCVLEFKRGDSKMVFVSERSKGRSKVVMNILNPEER